MKLSILPAALLAIAFLSQGCVSNKKFTELQSNYTDLQNKNTELSKKSMRVSKAFHHQLQG